MKRFLVFSFDQYYPGGGMNDFEGEFDSEEEIDEHYKQRKAAQFYYKMTTIKF